MESANEISLSQVKTVKVFRNYQKSREHSNLIRQVFTLSEQMNSKFFNSMKPSRVFHNQNNIIELKNKFGHLNSLIQELRNINN